MKYTIRVNWERLRKFNLFLIFFFASSLFVFFLLNGGAYARNIRYALLLHSPFGGSDITEARILDFEPLSGQTLPQGAGPDLKQGGYHLVIPKISVDAPVALPLDNTMKAILASLEEGVGLYPQSNQSRAVMLGHSSRASWYRGNYATVFSLLPRLDVFDEFYIVGRGKKYVYRVFSKKVLSPADTNLMLAGYPSGSEVDLITCYPIGSASKRNVVQATLVGVFDI